MFDIFRSKFYKKTKSLLKHSKKRLEAAKKKRFAVCKHLKNDLAELLKMGLDLKAYERVEGLLAEQNMASRYEYLEQCNSTIYDQLSNMENQRECPSECREAVATLMDAAARFADLPEVRELRTVFTKRYGSFPENLVSKEFVARLSMEPSSQERKIQIMEEVAQKSSSLWDPQSLREQLFKLAPPAQEKPDMPTSNRRKDAPDDDSYNVPSDSEDEIVSKHRRRDSSTSQDSRQTGSSSSGSCLSEDEVDGRKATHYGLIPPPYVKHNNAKGDSNVEEPMRSNDIHYPAGQEIDEASTHRSLRVNVHVCPPPRRQYEETKGARHRNAKSEVPALPARISSMSPETNDEYESMKKHRRANSLQPEMLAGHVHPKLPNYDDVLAMLATLRGR